MNIFYFKTMEDFLLLENNKEKIWLLLVAELCNFKHDDIKKENLTCYGAIFPKIIYGKEYFSDGLIAIELHHKPIFLEDISDNIINNDFINMYDSLLVYVDGLSAHIDSFLVNLFEVINEDTKIFGGGAGKLTLQQEPVVFTPTSILEDAALIIPLEQKLNIGVNHGWEFLEGPFVATKSEKNILQQINYESAFDVYKKIVELDSNMKFDNDNFFEIAKSYPLGIVTYEGEMIVRDPITVQDDKLILVGEMPRNSVINILKGNKKQLIYAAAQAAKEANYECEKKEDSLAIVVDCISRVLYLEESFDEEITEIMNNLDSPSELIGTLTLGEIANKSDKFITFYNKTCVVGVLC